MFLLKNTFTYAVFSQHQQDLESPQFPHTNNSHIRRFYEESLYETKLHAIFTMPKGIILEHSS